MALDPRISLAVQTGAIDFSNIVNAARDRRNFDAQQEQQKIINEQNAQQLAMQQETQQANLANIQSQIGARQQKQEQQATLFDQQQGQLAQSQLQTQFADSVAAAKRLNDAGDTQGAADIIAQFSNTVAQSNLPADFKNPLQTEINSALLDAATGNTQAFTQKLNSVASPQAGQLKSFAPIDLASGGKGIPQVDAQGNVTIQPIEGTVSKQDLEKAKADIKTQQKVEQTQQLEQTTATGQLKVQEAELKKEALEAKKIERQNKVKEANIQKDLLQEELDFLINDIDASAFTGLRGKVPFNLPETQDELNRLTKFLDNLTVGNLNKMTGNKTDKDIAILASAASGIQIEKDENGIPLRVAGSEEGLKKALNRIQTGLKRIGSNLDEANFREVGGTQAGQSQNNVLSLQEEEDLINKYL